MLLQMEKIHSLYGPSNIHWVYQIFIHSCVNGRLGCFHVLAVVNSVAMTIDVHTSFQIKAYIISGYIPRSMIAGSYDNYF